MGTDRWTPWHLGFGLFPCRPARRRGVPGGQAGGWLLLPVLVWPILFSPTAAFADEASRPRGVPLADETSRPRGVWGTAPACEGWRAGEEPRPELTLYEIGDQWIRRHVFYCLIRPQMTVRTPDGRWLLEVLCGEDARQAGYSLTLTLGEDEALTATWNAFGDKQSFTFGPFQHCGAAPANR